MISALLFFLIATQHLSPINLLPPTGPFAVGTRTYDWLDHSRPEKAVKNPSQHRQLVVQIWYPAEKSDEQQRSSYVPRLSAYRHVWSRSEYILASRVTTHALPDAPLANGNPFLVVLLSHGWEGTRTEYTILAEGLASRGFVVFGIDHPYMGRIALPNGEVTPATEEQFRSPGEIANYYGDDLKFALNQIAILNELPNGPFLHSLDLTRIAAIGHSSGFVAVNNACHRDARIRACVNIDAPGFTAPLLAGLRQPVFWIRLQRSGPVPADFLHTSNAPVYELDLNHAEHDSITDWPYLKAASPEARATAALHLTLLRDYIAAFLAKALSGQDSRLLQDTDDHDVEFRIFPRR